MIAWEDALTKLTSNNVTQLLEKGYVVIEDFWSEVDAQNFRNDVVRLFEANLMQANKVQFNTSEVRDTLFDF